MMNVLLRPFAREERNPDPLLVGLLSYNSNDGFGRAAGEQLNFAAPSEDEAEYPPGAYLKKGKVSRQDPMSHRIIEKRRRDRMNNCLADLSRLIPPEYLKKGRGRVEKTEIIEMAIRHLKYLQERANAADRQAGEDFRAGFQEAVAEAVRFLVEAQGYAPDGLCAQLASHLQRHIEIVTKGSPVGHEKAARSHPGSSSETASSSGSSGSSHGYGPKPGPLQPPPPPFQDTYDAPPDPPYAMECDRVAVAAMAAGAAGAAGAEAEEAPPDARRKRKELPDDYLHSYKFKNCIERRFSRSQDNEPADMSRTHAGKLYSHKRRRAGKAPPAPSASSTSASASSTSASASNSGSTEDARDTSPQNNVVCQDTSSDSPHHHHYEKPPPPTQFVPVFALNALGKYYVPLSVDSACLSRHLGAYDVLDARAAQLAAPLHPVTIHVNFQPCLNYHNNYVKREPNDREWRA